MPKVVRVCGGPWCSEYGSTKIFRAVKKAFGLKLFHRNDRIDLDYCRCLGYCSSGVTVAVDDRMIFDAQEETVAAKIEEGGKKITKGEIVINLDNDFLSDF